MDKSMEGNGLIELLEKTLEYINNSEDPIYTNITVTEIKEILINSINTIKNNKEIDINELQFVFSPTGSVQEISIDNDWGYEFIEIAEKIDKILESLSKISK